VSTSEQVAKHLPFLRRYARALTGSQVSGDAYVAATLEALLEDRSILDGPGTRVALFGLFTKIWHSVSLNGADVPADPASQPDQKVAKLTPLPRQAFLLVALEGFGEEDVGRILACDVAAVRRLVEQAGRELAAEIATDVLIIEDEAFIALDLEALVKGLGHRVIGVARTHAEAIKLASQKAPGLILADVQLADGSSGMNAVQELLRAFDVPAIFITAYPERLLTGERPEPTFLISKPYKPATVSAIASQALFFGRNAQQLDRMTAA
jgi:DNA-directed RNA polymerase specialized sigma24 family protein